MGITTINATVKNPKDERRRSQENFLVDSGATFSVVPRDIYKKIGLKPYREQKFALADGTIIKRKIGEAVFEIRGKRATTPVVLGKAQDQKIIGVLTLEAMGLVLDPFERKLYPAKLML